MIYVLSIPHWRPATVNELLQHYFVASKLKKRDRTIIYRRALEDRIPAATGRRLVETHVVYKPRGLFDPDNIMKSLLDGLKQSRLIVDDSDKWCDWTKPTLEKGTNEIWGTRLILTDIE